MYIFMFDFSNMTPRYESASIKRTILNGLLCTDLSRYPDMIGKMIRENDPDVANQPIRAACGPGPNMGQR